MEKQTNASECTALAFRPTSGAVCTSVDSAKGDQPLLGFIRRWKSGFGSSERTVKERCSQDRKIL